MAALSQALDLVRSLEHRPLFLATARRRDRGGHAIVSVGAPDADQCATASVAAVTAIADFAAAARGPTSAGSSQAPEDSGRPAGPTVTTGAFALRSSVVGESAGTARTASAAIAENAGAAASSAVPAVADDAGAAGTACPGVATNAGTSPGPARTAVPDDSTSAASSIAATGDPAAGAPGSASSAVADNRRASGAPIAAAGSDYSAELSADSASATRTAGPDGGQSPAPAVPTARQ